MQFVATNSYHILILVEERIRRVLSFLLKKVILPVPLEVAHLPEGIIYGSRDHALFLFFAAWLNRYGKPAAALISQAGLLWGRNSAVIDPLQPEPSNFEQEIQRVGPFGHQRDEGVANWRLCRKLLKELYAGDPRNIFLLSIRATHNRTLLPSTVRHIFRRSIVSFPGIGPKIFALMMIFFQEVDWPEDQKDWAAIRKVAVVPVDSWIMREMAQWGLVQTFSSDDRKVVGPKLTRFLIRFCEEEKIDHIELTHLLFYLGSEVCATARKRRTWSGMLDYCQSSCPACRFCTHFVPASGFEGDGHGMMGWKAAIPRKPSKDPTIRPQGRSKAARR